MTDKSDLRKQLGEKITELQETKKSESKSFCVDVHPSGSQLRREMRIEELKDEIAELEKKLNQ